MVASMVVKSGCEAAEKWVDLLAYKMADQMVGKMVDMMVVTLAEKMDSNEVGATAVQKAGGRVDDSELLMADRTALK